MPASWYSCYFPSSDQTYRVWSDSEAAAVRQVMMVICYSRSIKELETPRTLKAKLHIQKDGEQRHYEYEVNLEVDARYKGVVGGGPTPLIL